MMKKFFALLLAALMAVSLLTACGNTDVQDDQQEDKDVNETVEYRDLFEAEYWAAFDKGTDEWRHFWPEPVSAQKEYVRSVATEVQKRLNCVLSEEEMVVNTANVSKLFAVGDYKFSWINMKGTGPSFYKAGYLQTWSGIEGFDVNDKKWGSNTEATYSKYDGEHVYLMPDMVNVTSSSYGYDGGAGVLLFNNELIQYFNTASPHELYEQGKWTWDTFETYLGDVSEDRDDGSRLYGMSVYAAENLIYSAIFSNGGQVVRKIDSGYQFALTEARATAAMEWTADMYKSNNVVADTPQTWDRWASGNATFMLGDCAFGTSSSGSSEHWGLDNLDDFHFVSFPKGPDVADGETVNSAYTGSPWGTGMMFGCDPDDAAYIWNVLRDVELELADDEAESTWRRNTFFSDKSYEHYALRGQNVNYLYDMEMGTDVAKQLTSALQSIQIGQATPAQALGSVSALIQNALDEALN